MESFDINHAKAELARSKEQYASLLEMYADIKSKAQYKQIFPDVERRIYEVEESIRKHTVLIANYEDLQETIHMLERDQEEVLEYVRRVRVRFGE